MIMNKRDLFIDWMIGEIRYQMRKNPEIFIERDPFSYYNTSSVFSNLQSYKSYFSDGAMRKIEDLQSDLVEYYWDNTWEAYAAESSAYADSIVSERETEDWYEAQNDYFDNFGVCYYIFDTYIESIFKDYKDYYKEYFLTTYNDPFSFRFEDIFDDCIEKNFSSLVRNLRDNKIEAILA